MYRLTYWKKQPIGSFRETYAEFKTFEEALAFEHETVWNDEKRHNDEITGFGEHTDWYALKSGGIWTLANRNFQH